MGVIVISSDLKYGLSHIIAVEIDIKLLDLFSEVIIINDITDVFVFILFLPGLLSLITRTLSIWD